MDPIHSLMEIRRFEFRRNGGLQPGVADVCFQELQRSASIAEMRRKAAAARGHEKPLPSAQLWKGGALKPDEHRKLQARRYPFGSLDKNSSYFGWAALRNRAPKVSEPDVKILLTN